MTISVLDRPARADTDWLLFPRPLECGLQRLHQMQVRGLAELHEIDAVNSGQSAYLGRAEVDTPEITFDLAWEAGVPSDWLYQHIDNRYTKASEDLATLAADLIAETDCEASGAQCLVEHAATLFEYEHPDQRFNDGTDAMPILCGTTRGSCVDMHGYLMAAASSLNLQVQYLAGYWFHPERSETRDFHCWLVFELDGKTVFWDLAHHLKWGVSPLAPGLNPAGGRRVLMSYGRGNCFDTPVGQVEVSHFAEPLWLAEDGSAHRPELRIRIDGPATQVAQTAMQADGVDLTGALVE